MAKSGANGQSNGHFDDRTAVIDIAGVPPYSENAEEAILAVFLRCPDVLDEMRPLLNVPDFWRDRNQIIYQAMLDVLEIGDPVELVSVEEQLRRSGQLETVTLDYLEGLAGAEVIPASAPLYVRTIKRHKFTRDLSEMAANTLDDVTRRNHTGEELFERIRNRFAAIEAIADGQAASEEDEFNLAPAPEPMGAAAYRGVLGEIVQRIRSQTEAAPEAILGQLLVAIGNLLGRRPRWVANEVPHRCNLNLCLVGPTGAGRKGTSWGVTESLLAQCDPAFASNPPIGGMTSGEGLIEHAMLTDGRVLWLEDEFGRFMANCEREKNTLGHVVRQAFDGRPLCVPSRKDKLYLPNPHISIIGHITYQEFADRVTQQNIDNGLFNRFLFLHTYRTCELPEGGDLSGVRDALSPLIGEIMRAVEFARTDKALDRAYRHDADARKMWAPLYHDLTVTLPGRYGSATQRRAPIVRRLSLIYAVLDQDWEIRAEHLEAAMAFYAYCDATARRIFGDVRKDKKLARLIELLDGAPNGLTRSQINRKLGGGHLTPAELDRLLFAAEQTGNYILEETKTAGLPKHALIHRKYRGAK
jgi:DnaB helicase-like protein/uncharacterized protein DUF3987